MNKKAVSTGAIIVIILGLIVILLVVTGPLRAGYEYAKEKFFGETGIFGFVQPSREEEFVPYKGPVAFGEDKIVDDSVKAFVCAVNSLALGKPGWKEKNVCPEGFSFPGMPGKDKAGVKKESEKKDGVAGATGKVIAGLLSGLTGAVAAEQCSGALYGQSCVECSVLESGMNIAQLSDNDAAATDQLVDAVVDCWKKFKAGDRANVFCSKLVVPVTSSFSSWIIKKNNFRDKLNAAGDIGDDLAGYSFLGLGYSSQNFKWLLPSEIYVNFSPFYVCARKPSAWTFTEGSTGVDSVLITYDLDDCNVDNPPVGRDFTCSVKDFELPQEIGLGSYDWAFGVINKYKDPQYVVYYESFPLGENKAWHLDKSSVIFDTILIGATMNVLFTAPSLVWKAGAAAFKSTGRVFGRVFGRSAADVAGSGALKLAGQAGKELSKEALNELAESFTKGGYERLLKSEILFIRLRDAGFSDEMIESARLAFVKKYSQSQGLPKEAIFSEVFYDVRFNALPNLDPKKTDVLLRTLKELIENPLTEAEKAVLRNRQAVRQFFVKYLVKENGELLEREAIENLVSKAFSRELLAEMDEEMAKQFVIRNMDYADEIVDVAAGNVLKTQSFFGSAKLGISKQLEKEFDEITKSILELNKDSLQKFFAGTSLSEVKKTAIKEGQEALLNKGIAADKITETMASSEGYKLLFAKKVKDYVPIRFKDSVFNIPRPAIMRSLAAVPHTVEVIGRDFVWNPRAMRYMTAYMIATLLTEADAHADKFALHGGNTVVAQKPYRLELNKKYDLINNAEDYYLNLFKSHGVSSRFFLASPCKTDLHITKTDCSCLIRNGEYLMRNTNQPIEPSSVVFLKEPLAVYEFDKLSSVNKDSLVKVTFENIRMKVGIWPSFNKAAFNAIANNPGLNVKFTELLYNYTYLPAFDYIKSNGLSGHFGNKIRAGRTIDEAFTSYYLEHPTDYGIFGIWFWKEPFGAFDKFNLFVDGDKSDKANAVFRADPLSLDDFRVEFLSGFIYGSLGVGDILGRFMDKLVFSAKMSEELGKPAYSYKMLEIRDGLWSDVVRETYVNYVLVNPNKIDSSRVLKICENTIVGQTDLPEAKENIFENGVVTMRASAPCFSVSTDFDSRYKTNFCYSGDHSMIESAKIALFVAAAAIDVIVGITPLKPLAVPFAVLTGGGSAWLGEKLDEKKYWPKRGF